MAHVDGRIVDVNPAFRAVFGYTVEEALGSDGGSTSPPPPSARCSPSASAWAARDSFELIGVTKSGDSRYLEATARSIVHEGEECELLALRDVTDRRVAEEEAGVLAFQYAADLTVVAEVARRLPRTADSTSARLAICEAALEVCDGAMAVLMEPDGKGNLVSTAMAGAHCQPLLVPIDHSSSATAQVFNSREPFFADLSTHGGVSPQLVEATGLVTALWQPVLRDGDPVGVLLVAWDRHVTLISDRAAAVVGLFAAEAAVAVERVDILARLDELNTALAQQVEALRLSDQFKSDFVSSVSHELRTPLASILGYTDILVNGEVGEMTPDQEEFLEHHRPQRPPPPHADQRPADAVGARERTGRDPARADRPVRPGAPEHADPRPGGQRPPPAARGRPSRPAGDGVRRPRPHLAGAHQPGLERDQVHARRGLPGRDARRRRRSGVLTVVRLRASGSPRTTASGSSSASSGPATPSSGPSRAPGLGLAICKGIVDAHDGRLEVSSALGRGTTVTVTVPLEAAPEQGDDAMSD